jgi:VWFA-related protein
VVHRACFAAVLLASGTVALVAQSDAQSDAQRATFRSSLDLVSVAVVVRGPDGRIVSNLQARDFEVLDRGATRPIVQFHRGHEADARLALLVDSSGSMVLGAKRRRSRLATELLIAGFRETDAASVFSFDSRVRRLTPFTRDPDQLRAAVSSVEPFGITGLYDAIVGTVQTVVNDTPRARALLLLTDGIDTGSIVSPADAASAAAAVDIPLYVLSVADEELDDSAPRVAPPQPAEGLTLNELATRTGGLAAEAATIAQLSVATRTILNELRYQYVLAIPAGAEKGWHDLTVRVRRGRVRARSRNGYVVS